MSHTKGNWILCGNGKAIQNVKDPIFFKLGIRCGGIRIAEAHAIGSEEAEANARLIAAAPFLLAACKDILSFLKKSGYDTRIVQQANKQAEEV